VPGTRAVRFRPRDPVVTTDAGLDVVARLQAALTPEEPWRVAEPRGFTWWPSTFSQRVNAGPLETPAGLPAWRVRAELPLLRGVEGSAARFAVLARWNALRPGLSSLRWNGDDRTVSLHAAVLARPGEEARAATMLTTAALFQLGDAARDAHVLARELGGVLASSAPPGLPPRGAPDPLVEAWRRFAETGAEPGPFTRERLEATAAMAPPPWTLVHVDEAGLHGEVPCALPGEAPAGSAPGAGVALVHLLASQPHPVLGAGVIGALSLPPEAEPVPERAVSTAVLLNEAEARESLPFDALGAWCVHPQAGLSFVTFRPALLETPDTLERLAWDLAHRARWARGFLDRVHALRAPSPGA
jgi:hypothetical protein